jgi:hypothetical protein
LTVAVSNATETIHLVTDDQVTTAKSILRDLIQKWRKTGKSWDWVKAQPEWSAYAALGGK